MIIDQLRTWRSLGLIKVRPLPDGTLQIKVLSERLPSGYRAMIEGDLYSIEDLIEPKLRKIFAHWQTVHKKRSAKLDQKRRRLILRALKAYSATQLCECIDGYARSPHHMGQNATGTKYDDIGLMLRDAAHIEAGLQYRRELKPALIKSRDDPQARLDVDTSDQAWIAAMRVTTGNPNWTPPENGKSARYIGPGGLSAAISALTSAIEVSPKVNGSGR